MSVAKQDPDTGRVYPNGALGRFLERVRWWGGALLLPTLFLMAGYSFHHYGQHVEEETYRKNVVEPFVLAGDRWTPAMAEAQEERILRAMEAMMGAHVGEGPHGDMGGRMARIENLLLERLPK